MKKKYFFKFFLFTVFATLVTFTACKDYDDDISRLESEISTLKGMSTDLTAIKADVAAAQTAANNALAKANEALEAAQGTGDAAAVEAAQEAADKAQAKADEVEAKATELEGLVEVLEGKVAALEAMDNASQEDLEALSDELNDLKEQVAIMGGLELNNLVFIPDFVDYSEGAIGIVYFNEFNAGDLEEGGCGLISSPTLLRYRVSPKSTTEDLIDKENLYFEFNAPKVRSTDPLKSRAEFVSLENGVLTVRAFVTDSISKVLGDIDDNEQVPQLQLIVGTNSGNDVISDWITVRSETIIDYFLANNQFEEERGMVFDWEEYSFAKTLQDAKNLGANADAVVQIKYDQTFDLIGVVETIFRNWESSLDALNTDDYGLTYKFDLKFFNDSSDTEEDIEYITVDNPTDQQDFINLIDGDKGTVKSKVYTAEDSRTAIGRTPIVRVQLMNDDCVVETAYIKINWVEDIVDPITVEISDTYTYSCGPAYLKSNVEWMNLNIYDKLGMTKTEFHNAYYLDDNVYQVDELIAIPGDEVTEIKDTESGQTTYLFNWKHIVESHSETTTARIVYRDKDTNRIVVEVLATLTVEPAEFKLYGLNNTYWKENGSLFTVNPLVYLGDEAGDEVNIHADLLNGFLDKDGNYTGDELEIINDLDNILTSLDSKVYFLFDETKLDDYKYFIDGTEYSVAEGNLELSPNHTQLLLGGEVAANIETVGFTSGYRIYLDTDGTDATPEAKALIGQRVPVKLVVDQCGNLLIEGPTINSVGTRAAPAVDLEVLGVYTIKEFEVFFIEPIKVNANIAGNFTDAVIDGSRIGVDEGLTFTDWRNYIVREEGFGEDATEKQKWASELFVYYDIQTAVWDITNATSNLKLVGGNRVPTEDYTEGPVSSLNYQIEYDEPNNELVFFNNSGSALVESFMIYVPVTVGHKWGTLKATVAIEVNPAEEVN